MRNGKRGSTRRGLWPSAVAENFYESASNDPAEPQLWGYTDRWSYQPGDTIRLHVSTTLPAYDIEIYRDGAVATTVYRQVGNSGSFQQTPDDCSVNGCGWPVDREITIGADWRSGGYVIRLCGRLDDGRTIEACHLAIIRAPAGNPAPILQVAATGTWLAYNDWGGSNHYEGITGPHRDQFSPRVSMLRPFARGFVKLPEGAPRIPLRTPPAPFAALRHPHMEWAYANGYSKKYASAGWASYDRHFLRWAEADGYAVDLCTLHDIHDDPAILSNYRTVVFTGHDEYWSKEMRDGVDAYIEAGGRAARFAGNFLWQTRIEAEGRTQVCYKYRYQEDPLHAGDRRSLTTTAWEAQAVRRPGALTFGVNALRGMYVGWGRAAARHSGGFTVYRPEHWAFAGTDLTYGDVFGGPSRVFGYEVDGLAYTFRDGLPYPTGEDGAATDIDIIAMAVAVMSETNGGERGTDVFLGEDDLAFAAEAVYGSASPEHRRKLRYGSGMVVSFRKGAGEVFTAGTCEWVAGLIDGDPFVVGITRNVLDRFCDRAT